MTAAVPWTVVARTGDELATFGPYVPSVDERGVVAFQATCRDGQTVVGGPRRIAGPEVISHPDLDDDGNVCFYARSSGRGLLVCDAADGGGWQVPAPVGPLGPTMDAGRVAFRAGDAAVGLAEAGQVRWLPLPPDVTAVHGLPVVVGERVVVRADRAAGAWIGRWSGQEPDRWETLAVGADLGRFPSLSPDGRVAWVATRADGSQAICAHGDERPTLVDTRDGAFTSLRGVVLRRRGFVFYGTPPGGTLGVYLEGRRLVGFGEVWEGARVVDLALNPVSVSERYVAIRLRLDDGREQIVRFG